MQWRSGTHLGVLVILTCAILSPGNCVRRLDSPPLLQDEDHDLKGYLLAKTISTSSFPKDATGSTSLAEYLVRSSSPVTYGQFWLDLLSAMKSVEEEEDVDETPRRLGTTGIPLHLNGDNVTSPNSAYLEPLVAMDGNKSGLLVIVKQEGLHAMDGTDMFTGNGKQKEDPNLVHIADHNLSLAEGQDSHDSHATTKLKIQLEPVDEDGAPLMGETDKNLTSRMSETNTQPNTEFVEKLSPSAPHILNTEVAPIWEDKLLKVKRSNRVARAKRSTVVPEVPSDMWRAVPKPVEQYQIQQVNSGLRNPFILLSEGQRPQKSAEQWYNGAVDEAGLIHGSPNHGSVPYSLVHNLGPHGSGNLIHHITATKEVGRGFQPEREGKQIGFEEYRQYQLDLMDSSGGDQTYLDEGFVPVHRADIHQTSAEWARNGQHTLEGPYHPPGGTEDVASTPFALQIPNTNNEHYVEEQGRDPVDVEVVNGASSNEDVKNQTRLRRAGQLFATVYRDDEDIEGSGQDEARIPAKSERLLNIRSPRRIRNLSKKTVIRKHDDAMKREEELSDNDDLTPETADVRNNEIEDDKVEAAGDGPSAQSSVLEKLLERLERCLRSQTVAVLDSLEGLDEATLWPGVQLVRLGGPAAASRSSRGGGSSSSSSSTTMLGEDEDDRWMAMAVDKLATLLRTHAIRLRLTSDTDDEREEGRRIRYRHQYKHMFPLVVMGYMVMSSFLVPLGFQLMAVLSGKALLLSKMALAVAGMAGFKRLFLAGLGPEYPVHHEPYPVFHEHHASFVK